MSGKLARNIREKLKTSDWIKHLYLEEVKSPVSEPNIISPKSLNISPEPIKNNSAVLPAPENHTREIPKRQSKPENVILEIPSPLSNKKFPKPLFLDERNRQNLGIILLGC